MSKLTRGVNGSGKRQPLGDKAIAILAALRDHGAMTNRQLREMFNWAKKEVGVTLCNMRKSGYVEVKDATGFGQIFEYTINAAGLERIKQQEELLLRKIGRLGDPLWEPNVTRRIGDLGGLRVASVWAYAQQVGA